MSDCCLLLKKEYQTQILDLKNEYHEYKSLYNVIMNTPIIREEIYEKNQIINELKQEIVKLQEKNIFLKFENIVIKLLNK